VTRKPFLISCLALTVFAVLGVFVERAQAIPPNGTLLLFTVDADTGVRVGNVPITVRQVEGRWPFQSLSTTTDSYGRLYVAVPPGTYQITASGYSGAPIIVSVGSRGEVYVGIPVSTGRTATGLDDLIRQAVGPWSTDES
jgi:hypothetical protein